VPPKAQTLSPVTLSGGLYQIPLPEGPWHEFKKPWGHIFSKRFVPAGPYLPSRSIPTFGEAPKVEVKGSQELFRKTATFACPGARPTRFPLTRLASWREAGSARPQTRIPARPGAYFLLATVPSLTNVFEMKGHGIRAAVPCGRAERIPPRKPPFTLSPGFPPQGLSARLGPPWRGGLCTPAGKTCARPKHLPIRPTAARSLLGDHAIPGACVRPRNADARSASLRENRPSPTRMGEPNPLGTRTAWFSSSGNPTTN
jgi:hypothetical protein